MGGAHTPGELAPGLDLFVAAWLEEWVRYGGFVTARADSVGSIGWNVEPTGPGYAEPAPDLPDAVKDSARIYNSAHHGGRMRAMLGLLDVVPHAREALHAHMLSHAIGQYYSGEPGATQ